MPKPGKSSASSGTRKKHARRAAGDEIPLPLPQKKPKVKKGEKKAPPKVKQYIPPTKPTPIQIDPLDSLGLANRLDKDLVVILRRLSKKDAVTKTKAIEELRVWIDRDETSASVGMVPVWLHHYPSLVLHPSRRLRVLSASLHDHILNIPALRDSIVFHIREISPSDQRGLILGAWCLSTQDVDRTVTREAARSWSRATCLKRPSDTDGQPSSASESVLALEDDGLLDSLSSVLYRALLDTEGFYSDIFPPAAQMDSAQGHGKQSHVHGRLTPSTSTKHGDESPRRAEIEEENEDDRNARLRVAALGSLRWLIGSYSSGLAGGQGNHPMAVAVVKELLAHPSAFSVLSHSSHSSATRREGRPYGENQPLVRRAAWSLVGAITPLLQEDGITPLLARLSTLVLFAAWSEPDSGVRSVMWEPLLRYLKSVPRAWQHANTTSPIAPNGAQDAPDDEDDGDSSEDDEDEHIETPLPPTDISTLGTGKALILREFLRFLELGCGGSPTQGYPTLVVILSTIPTEILPCNETPLGELFASIWAAFNGKALSTSLERERRESVTAFISAVVECTGVYARRLTTNGDDTRPIAVTLVQQQWDRLWVEALCGRFRLSEHVVGALFGKALLRLYSINSEILHAAWRPLEAVSLTVEQPKIDAVLLLASISSQFAAEPALSSFITSLAAKWGRGVAHSPVFDAEPVVVVDLERAVKEVKLIMGNFPDMVVREQGVSEGFNSIIHNRLPLLIRTLPAESVISLLSAYISSYPTEAQGTWDLVLRTIADALESGMTHETAKRLTKAIALAVNTTQLPLPSNLKASDALSGYLRSLVDGVLAGPGQDGRRIDNALLSGLFKRRGTLITESDYVNARDRLTQFVAASIPALLGADESEPSTLPDIIPLMSTFMEYLSQETSGAECISAMFVLAYVNKSAPALAIWESWRKAAPLELRVLVKRVLTGHLKSTMSDVESQLSPREVLDLIPSVSSLDATDNALSFAILPSQRQYDDELRILRSYAPHPALATVDVLVSSDGPDSPDGGLGVLNYDAYGLSAYARTRIALLEALASNRRLVQENIWALRHILALEVSARDFLALPSHRNPLFSSIRDEVSSTVKDVITASQQMLAYAMSSLTSDLSVKWHQDLTAALRKSKTFISGGLGLGAMADAVAEVYWASASSDAALDRRVFHGLLRGLLREATTEASDMWLVLAQANLDSSPSVASAIIHCVTILHLESPRLDRIRNELASRLSGVKPAKSNTEGLRLLRLLNLSAPLPDSDITFLPQQRTIFMFQALQKWVEENDELDEEIESQLAELFVNVVAILQSLPGAHWDFILDVIESNLDNASLTDSDSLPMLWRTLRLVAEIDDLVSSNKALREVWNERRASIYGLVKKSLVVSIPAGEVSEPRDICRNLVVSLAAADPTALVDGDSISTLSHLLLDPSLAVQITAHDLLHHASKPYTENIVLEAEVDTGTDIKPVLPSDLMRLVEDFVFDADEVSMDALPYLLAWTIIFDLFTDASPKVKSGYLDSLRSSGTVEGRLLPTLFSLLNIGSAGKPFALDIWAVDDFDVSLYDEESPVGINVLAGHVYYRALITVPSLIRGWWSECKDRQLSSSVASYTSSTFSPSIITQQLAGVRTPSILETLQTENFTVKVQPTVREIIASYLVDEQHLEIALHIPSDYPLHAIEVKDVRRVGAQENKWRTWLLNVNQIAQTGSIVNALLWFKQNVSSFFDGKVECAICYSVISVMDRSLPNKPCKTCKNRFHASCLYKWFNTSHSSSCPLCRSNIM